MDDDNDFYDTDEDECQQDYDDECQDDCADVPENGDENEETYTVLKESDIRQLMEDDISALLQSGPSLSRVEASLILRHYNWIISKVHDALFADESGLRKKVGLLDQSTQLQDSRQFKKQKLQDAIISCGICFEDYDIGLIKSAACGHSFCVDCWRLYISTSVKDGPGCLTLRCPEPSCVAAVGDDLVNEVAFEEDKKRYDYFLVRSYVESNKKRKWCPTAGCEFAIAFEAGHESFDVTCLCSHSFCWKCCEERHRPLHCDMVSNWIAKNNSESDNETWKKAYTKPCPKCSRPIEKNKGCMHMTCSVPCSFHFCWMCLQDWSVHGYRGPCNAYTNAPSEETCSLRLDLLRYQHYFDRWAANETSRQLALTYLKNVQTIHGNQMNLMYGTTDKELGFLTEAWEQIVECRRVLKWTYAYGYYIPKEENAKKKLFEFLQGQAESSLEGLHGLAEKDLNKFLTGTTKPDDPAFSQLKEDFKTFQKELTRLTGVTKNYFQNLVTALENGLSDVTSKGCPPEEELSYQDKLKEYSRLRAIHRRATRPAV